MSDRRDGDPRLDPQSGEPPRIGGADGEADIRPAVALPARGLPGWLIAVVIVALALLLFTVLETRRRAAAIPSAASGPDDAVRTATAAPPLYLPPSFTYVPPPAVALPPTPTPTPTPTPLPPPPPPQIVYVPQPTPAPVRQIEPEPRPATNDRSSALVYDASVPDQTITAGRGGPAETATAPGAAATVARARRLTNRATTVGQGTLIPAVLESALDSNRPGPARALVTRNVRGADGSRILIPRGSRLFGEYRADIAPGQNRVLITWTSLVRPDGVTVALTSPSADTLGRVGVRGQVDTHFLSRFGAALLQSALDIGVSLASNRVNQQVVVGLPGSIQTGSAGSLLSGARAQPTIRVRQGVSVSVFVARDLDFTGVQQR